MAVGYRVVSRLFRLRAVVPERAVDSALERSSVSRRVPSRGDRVETREMDRKYSWRAQKRIERPAIETDKRGRHAPPIWQPRKWVTLSGTWNDIIASQTRHPSSTGRRSGTPFPCRRNHSIGYLFLSGYLLSRPLGISSPTPLILLKLPCRHGLLFGQATHLL